MTSEPDRHPNLAELGEYAADALDERVEQAVAAHVAACARCAATLTDIRAVPTLLGALPVEPMPAHVAARIDAALAAERRTGADSAVVPIRRRRLFAMASAAAGVAVVVAATSLLAGNTRRGGSTAARDTSSATAGRAGAGEASSAYDAKSLPEQVRALVARSGATAPRDSADSSGSPGVAAPPPGMVAKPLAGCLSAAGVPPVRPLAVDDGTFAGAPATVIVLPAAPGRADVLVVARGCRAGHAEVRYRLRGISLR